MRIPAVFIIFPLAFFFASCAIDTYVPADGDAYSSTSSNYNYSGELLDLINQYRISNRLNPLSFDERLTALAESHSTDMYRRGNLNHDNFPERFNKSGSDHCVENVGWNFRTPGEEFAGWKKSRDHNKNMLVSDIRKA